VFSVLVSPVLTVAYVALFPTTTSILTTTMEYTNNCYHRSCKLDNGRVTPSHTEQSTVCFCLPDHQVFRPLVFPMTTYATADWRGAQPFSRSVGRLVSGIRRVKLTAAAVSLAVDRPRLNKQRVAANAVNSVGEQRFTLKTALQHLESERERIFSCVAATSAVSVVVDLNGYVRRSFCSSLSLYVGDCLLKPCRQTTHHLGAIWPKKYCRKSARTCRSQTAGRSARKRSVYIYGTFIVCQLVIL
jgi:hypothetical protein